MCSIKLADFNGDNHLDVALGNGSGGSNNQIDVFFGNGNGTFNPTFSTYPTAKHPQLLLGDVDNQNGTDIVYDVPDTHASYYYKNNLVVWQFYPSTGLKKLRYNRRLRLE